MEIHFELQKMYVYRASGNFAARKKNRNVRKITELFPSTKVIEAHFLHLTKCLTLLA